MLRLQALLEDLLAVISTRPMSATSSRLSALYPRTNYHARPAVQCSQQTGLADIELRGTGETQFGIRPSRILSKWMNQGFSRILWINAVFTSSLFIIIVGLLILRRQQNSY